MNKKTMNDKFFMNYLDLLRTFWPGLLTRMAKSADCIGKGLIKSLVALLSPLSGAIADDDIKLVYGILGVIQPLEEQIFPRIGNKTTLHAFERVTKELIPVMAEVKRLNNTAPLKKFIHTARPEMEPNVS